MKKLFYTLLVLTALTGCAATQTVGSENTADQFGIYLVNNNQLILSEADIASYDAVLHTFTLTSTGVAKMQAHQPSNKINAGLYQKPFSVKLGDSEIYRGKFWSNASSASESGIVLTDVLMVRPAYNTLTVASGYPSEDISPDNTALLNDNRIIERFRTIGKLK